MLEDIYNGSMDINNKKFYLIFKIFDENNTYIGDYTLRLVGQSFSLVKNDSFTSLDLKVGDFKPKAKGDKFAPEFIDALTSELENPKDLINTYDLLDSNLELSVLKGTDFRVNAYVGHIQKNDNGKYENVYTRDAIFNDERWNNLAVKHCQKNINAKKFGKKQSAEVIGYGYEVEKLKNEIKHDIVNNYCKNSSLYYAARNYSYNKEGILEVEDLFVNKRLDVHIEDVLLGNKHSLGQKRYIVGKELNKYITLRDMYILHEKAKEIKEFKRTNPEIINKKPLII